MSSTKAPYTTLIRKEQILIKGFNTMTTTPKQLVKIIRNSRGHWVGDGFPVRNLLAYNNGLDELQSPFLLLDYAGPYEFSPTTKKLGVGEHPHRGFETVTIVYDGEVAHRDSSGAGGIIGKGDVQWMTAASGVVHEEFHSERFAKAGGRFEVVQLWVNLPAKDKMTAPRYQGIQNAQIPVVTLPNEQGSVRVIAGEFNHTKGAALTHTPMHIWDMQLHTNATVNLETEEGYSGALLVLDGQIQMNEHTLSAGELGLMSLTGSTITVRTGTGAKVLFLSGEPINEPVVGHGPFVMNTQAEIYQAMRDYQQGKMGHL